MNPPETPPGTLPEPLPDATAAGDTLAAYLAGLDAAKHAAAVAETRFRQEAAAQAEKLAGARAHAFRRADLMAALVAVLRDAGSPEMAVAAAQVLLRARLGWDEDSPARTEVLARFAPVAVALHEAAQVPVPEGAQPADPCADPAGALAAFEAWYAQTRPGAFWYLFEHYMPDTPLVDF
ncbi:hypothetical protein ACI7BZ_11020 [Xanthobacter sp. AM11]|uniref:hypothetical protein n=1 Tax=Xanthobacter sp. AM11 TaxID=3380643 RepID=UPI0039BF799C